LHFPGLSLHAPQDMEVRTGMTLVTGRYNLRGYIWMLHCVATTVGRIPHILR
jgi:hypothetical protein